MRNVALSLKVLRGAFKGALISLIVAFIVLSIVGILFGYGGPLLALYFAAWLVLYVAPFGMLLGAVITSIQLMGIAANKRSDTSKNGRQSISIAVLAWIGLPLILIVSLLIALPRLTDVKGNVRHGVTWTTETRPDCPVPAVILMLVEYAQYEVVCSLGVLDYLQTQNDVVVPITYRVIYDFGEARSYQLTHVGQIEISWSEWLGGPSGCGGQYTPPCDSPQVKNGSPLYKSSWSGK